MSIDTLTKTTSIADVAVGDFIDFYPILANADVDPDIENLMGIAEHEFFSVESIEVDFQKSITLRTNRVIWSFNPTDEVVVCGNEKDGITV